MAISNAIKVVRDISSDLVILPESPSYDEITASYFSELERELKPAAFLTPSSTSEVADILKALKPFANSLKIAIAGSGQQTTPAVANVRDGLTIHLRNLRGIEVNAEKKVVSIAAGERMGDVYEKVAASGLGVMGNRHSTGGIGGDAIQGGLSYFSYARGFVCDDVVNYEVVLGSGEIVNANAENNKDLWVALKGGGSNFGVVTRFDLRAFELGQMWGGKIFYFEPSFKSQIQALVDYLHDPNPDTNIHICVSMGYAAAIGSIMCMNDIFNSKPEKPKALGPFADVSPQVDQMKSLRTDSLKGLTTEAFGGAARNRVLKTSATVKADVGILEFALAQYHATFEKLEDITNILFSITFEAIPISLIEQSVAKGGNATGLQPLDGPLVVILFYTSWNSPSDDDKAFAANKDVLATIEKESQSKGLFAPYVYLNYAWGNQDPMSAYGEDSKSRLQAVSKKYDPDGFFQVAVAGPFKLFR